jgi:hypothetical protein
VHVDQNWCPGARHRERLLKGTLDHLRTFDPEAASSEPLHNPLV